MCDKNKWIFFLTLVVGVIFAGDKIAVATKVFGKAEVGRDNPVVYSMIKPGTILSDGDRVRTGSTGFVTVIFIDDKSALKIKENTELEITGILSATKINKQINMDIGTLRATVEKQKNTEFVIRTPTSVASVKGTDFWLISDPFTGDQLIGLEGTVNLLNLLTGVSIDVLAGYTGNSTIDGAVNDSETDEATIPDDPDEAEVESGSELRIYLEGPDGTQKVILIQYQ